MEAISIEQLAPLIKDVVDSGSEFRLFPKGQSMLPTIVENEDSVMLASPVNLKKYDAVLYRRKSGQYVLHRIVKITDNTFNMCGDNQIVIEKGIQKDQIIAKVIGIYKKDTLVDVQSPEYLKQIKLLYSKKHYHRTVNAVKGFIYRLYKKVIKKQH